MDPANQMSRFVNKSLNLINNNKILSSILAMFLVLYAAMAAPKLPTNVVKMFDNVVVKLVYMFLMAYLVSKNPSVAIVSAAALLITIQTLSYYEASDNASQKVATVVQIKQQMPTVVEVPSSETVSEPKIEEIPVIPASPESPKVLEQNDVPQPVDVPELAPFESSLSIEQRVDHHVPSSELTKPNEQTELTGYETGDFAQF